jgi:hypothetical protein
MSWFEKFKTWWTFKQNSGHRGAPRTYILDGAGLGGQGRGGARLSPPECVQVLERVSRFTQKEQIRMVAVFEGHSLREVSDGGDFKGVTVHFVEKATELTDKVLAVLRDNRRRGAVTVITGDRRMEENVHEAGGQTMRVSTFRKAMEGALGGNGGPPDGPRRDRDRDRDRHRRHRRPPPRSAESAPEKPSGDKVSDLVDLVE